MDIIESLSYRTIEEEAALYKIRLEAHLQKSNPDFEVESLIISEDTGLVTAEIVNHFTGCSSTWEFYCDEDEGSAKLVVLEDGDVMEEYDLPKFIFTEHAVKEVSFPSYVDLSEVSYITEDILEDLL